VGTLSSGRPWYWPPEALEAYAAVKIKIAWIGKSKEPAIQSLAEDYLKRISRYVQVEALALRDEAALLQLCGRAAQSSEKLKSGKSTLVLMDSRGEQLSSQEFARFVGDYQDRNPLPLVFAVGPADGFSDETLKRAQQLISLGRITLPHQLARVVLLEQIYRALTILKGHPYHSGH
jgi:23S rRNA (pseudouridine1915-N3)-methyltransferase